MSAVLQFTEMQAAPVKAPVPFVASLTSISKRYSNGVLALDDLSLNLRRGEIVAL